LAMPPPDPTRPAEDAPFRILVIVSRPLDQSELPEIDDQWALYSDLSAVKTRAQLDFLRPPTIEQLRAEILGGYDVVHFDGHCAFGLRCPSCSSLNPPESRNVADAPHPWKMRRQGATSPSSVTTGPKTLSRPRIWRG